MTGNAQKLGVTFPISAELLAQSDLFRQVLAGACALDTRTPRQRQTDEARLRNEVREAQKPIRAEHAALLERLTDPTLCAIAELHGPKFSFEFSTCPHCEGCDPGSYAEDRPEFPCATYELITDALTTN